MIVIYNSIKKFIKLEYYNTHVAMVPMSSQKNLTII